jgi:hypothetical protein
MDMVSRFKSALNNGMAALGDYTPPASEAVGEEEADDPPLLSDYFNKDPLPFVIGTRAFLASEHAGLPNPFGGGEAAAGEEKAKAEGEKGEPDGSDDDTSSSDDSSSSGVASFSACVLLGILAAHISQTLISFSSLI